MAYPTVVINNSTGSDTQASGAGPSTAVFGTLAATHTNTTVNITDAVALGGVATDGSAVLWVNTGSGRQWSAITAISGSSGAWVVTVASAYAGTASGLTWAIGGKRATLASSLQLGGDYLAGWTVDIQETGTDYTLTVEYVFSVGAAGTNPTALWTSTSATRPVIKTSTNSLNCLFNVSNCQHTSFSNLNLKYTGTGGTVRGILPRTANGQYLTLTNCILDGWYNGWDGDNSSFSSLSFCAIVLCEIKNCTNRGITNQAAIVVDRCYVHGNTHFGVNIFGANNPASIITGSVVDSNGSTGAGDYNIGGFGGGANVVISGCTVSNSPSGSGINANVGQVTSIVLVNSIIYGNATYGIDTINTGVSTSVVLEFNCAYGGNGTSARHGLAAGTGAITLTSPPFASGTDFALNGTAGGGPLCKSAGAYPPNSTASTGPDIGAIPGGTFGLSAGGFPHLAGRGGLAG